jgi:hypothetical protein
MTISTSIFAAVLFAGFGPVVAALPLVVALPFLVNRSRIRLPSGQESERGIPEHDRTESTREEETEHAERAEIAVGCC